MAAVGTLIPVYLCPSVSKVQRTRGPDNRIRLYPPDALGVGIADGGGMACIDYGGIKGPDPTNTLIKDPVTNQQYADNGGVLIEIVDPALEALRVRPGDISDGLSSTFLVGESSGRGATQGPSGAGVPGTTTSGKWHDRGAWAEGANIFYITNPVNYLPAADDGTGLTDGRGLFSEHPGGAQAVLCDGSVHMISELTDLLVLAELSTRAGGETTPAEALK